MPYLAVTDKLYLGLCVFSLHQWLNKHIFHDEHRNFFLVECWQVTHSRALSNSVCMHTECCSNLWQKWNYSGNKYVGLNDTQRVIEKGQLGDSGRTELCFVHCSCEARVAAIHHSEIRLRNHLSDYIPPSASPWGWKEALRCLMVSGVLDFLLAAFIQGT